MSHVDRAHGRERRRQVLMGVSPLPMSWLWITRSGFADRERIKQLISDGFTYEEIRDYLVECIGRVVSVHYSVLLCQLGNTMSGR